MPEWRFRRMQPGEMNVDPIEAEFFSTASLDSMTDALVRESVQNSLDARRGGQSARVRVSFPPPLQRPQGWFGGLWPHLEASRSGLAEVPDPKAPLPFILVEDFGTRGLQGDPEQSEDDALDAQGPRNDFYYFWRNIGRSRKGSSDLGRWGLGKTVFPATSRINAFLALTVRADDQRALLMGQSVLRIHKIDSGRFYPYGYFGMFSDDFAVPVDDAKRIAAFQTDFATIRNQEPGLSVVIPWPDPGITPQSVITSVIHHYFVPILAGDLVVEVAQGSQVQRLDNDNLVQVIGAGGSGLRSREAMQLERLVRLTHFGLTLDRSDFVRLDDPEPDSAPRWPADCLHQAPATLRSRFEAGRAIGITVPVWVKPIEGEPVLSEFDVYLERDDELNRGEEHFVRDGITIAGVRGGIPKGVRAVVVTRHAALATLLGDSENPAHTEWQERSPKFKNRYRHGPFTLRFVRNAPRELTRALTRPAAGRNEELLANLFSLVLPTEETIVSTTKVGPDATEDGRSGTNPVIRADGTPPRFQILKTSGGFRLAGGNSGTIPSHLVVKVAYEVRRGDPFARYQPPDFDLAESPITIATEGLEIQRSDGNVLVLRVRDVPFQLDVDGFDQHRDIRVRVATENVAQ